MLLLQDALGLLRRPRATLARIDGRRGSGHGLTGICLSATLPAPVAELAALGPYSGPAGLGGRAQPAGELAGTAGVRLAVMALGSTG